jgi:hypothetical protein
MARSLLPAPSNPRTASLVASATAGRPIARPPFVPAILARPMPEAVADHAALELGDQPEHLKTSPAQPARVERFYPPTPEIREGGTRVPPNARMFGRPPTLTEGQCAGV